jgi:hypothetical protein
MVWRLCIVAIIAGMIGLLAVYKAAAHHWYELRCCQASFDCGPVPNGSVVGGPDGWRVRVPGATQPTIVPYSSNKVRPIPPEAPIEDRGVFHVCTVQGKPDGSVLCVYIPDGGA